MANLDDTFMRYGASIRVQRQRGEQFFYLRVRSLNILVFFRAKCLVTFLGSRKGTFAGICSIRSEREQGTRKSWSKIETIRTSATNYRFPRWCFRRRIPKSKSIVVYVFLTVYYDSEHNSIRFQVLKEEMAQIGGACEDLGGKEYRPSITVIVGQKRHHTRFFPMPNEGYGRADNVCLGTVVDKTIVHPKQFEFYLCSHFGIQVSQCLEVARPFGFSYGCFSGHQSSDSLSRVDERRIVFR